MADDAVFKGLALKAIVVAAEGRMTGREVKRRLFADLELDTLLDIDLRESEPPPAMLPTHAVESE